jgi:hypothetical protein
MFRYSSYSMEISRLRGFSSGARSGERYLANFPVLILGTQFGLGTSCRWRNRKFHLTNPRRGHRLQDSLSHSLIHSRNLRLEAQAAKP